VRWRGAGSEHAGNRHPRVYSHRCATGRGAGAHVVREQRALVGGGESVYALSVTSETRERTECMQTGGKRGLGCLKIYAVIIAGRIQKLATRTKRRRAASKSPGLAKVN
jgi:hypothetical protein